MQFILGLGTMLVVAFLFTKIKSYITNTAFRRLKKKFNGVAQLDIKEKLPDISTQEVIKAVEKAVDATRFNCTVGKSYKKGKEAFSWTKFKKIFDLGNGVEWIKSCKEILDLRKLTIYCIVLGAIYGYAYFQGRLNAPVQVNMSYDKEWIMNINGEEIYKPKFSNDVFIRDSKTKEVLKQIRAKDMGLLRKKLKPISFQLKPIFVAGGGVGEEGLTGELGAGISWIRMWRNEIDTFLTNRGIYLGTSYKLKALENSAIGIGIGKGFKKLDNRLIFYWRFNF